MRLRWILTLFDGVVVQEEDYVPDLLFMVGMHRPTTLVSDPGFAQASCKCQLDHIQGGLNDDDDDPSLLARRADFILFHPTISIAPPCTDLRL